MKCPKCNKEIDMLFKYCPHCGLILGKIDGPIFDIQHIYTHCTVEVLESSLTGETSVGWYRTDETEEI